MRLDRRDWLTAALLFASAALYWTALPRSLGGADESVHLYEAKRVLGGEILYRDVFNFITPGWFYLMAALFRIFGTTIETARGAMAVVHGTTTALIYLTGRRIGMRRSLCWLPALGYLAVCQPAWPIVSQHWLSTLLCAALLFACAHPGHGGAAAAFRIGALLGLLIGVQQQRGAFMGLGVAVWLVAETVRRRRYGTAPQESLPKTLASLAAGTLLVVGALAAVATGQAGARAVWYALVTFPLFNYRSQMSCGWGDVNLMTAGIAGFTYPALLKYLPVALLLTVARLGVLLWRRQQPDAARTLLLLLVFSSASTLSIAYFPDFIKIAFVAFVFLIAAAENLNWMIRHAPVPGIGAALLAGAIVVSGRHLHDNMIRLRDAYPVQHATAFGRIDFASEDEARLRDTVAALLRDTGSRYLYGYPILADLYLTVPAENPTRFGFFFYSDYHTPAQVQEVLDVLAARRLPYIVVMPRLLKPDDPILAFIAREYEPTSPTLAGRVIYRLKRLPGSTARRADEEHVGDASGRRDEPPLGRDLEVPLQKTPLRPHGPDVLATIAVEQEPLPAVRRLGIEVQHDEAASDQAREAGKGPVGKRIREMMQRARHDRGVKALMLRHVLEPHELEPAAGTSPPQARERDVVGIDVDAEVLAGHRQGEPAAATPEVQHTFHRSRRERRRRLAQGAHSVEHVTAVMEHRRTEHPADGRRRRDRHAGAVYQPAAAVTTGAQLAPSMIFRPTAAGLAIDALGLTAEPRYVK